MRDTVLLLTHSGDFFTVDRVQEALRRRGIGTFRLDTDLFPTQVRLGFEDGGTGPQAWVTQGDRTLGTDRILSVWSRRVWSPQFSPDLDPEYLSTCVRESQTALLGFLSMLDDRPWLNPPQADHLAGQKLRQLRVAREVGLPIPRTCITNDPERVRRFWDQVEGRMITKLLTPVSTSMEGGGPFVHTSRVTADDLDALEGLSQCPMVFQEAIPKACELRVALVEGEPYTGVIRAPDREDWRTTDPSQAPLSWEHGAPLPSTLQALRRLMDRFGLIYGGVDLIRTPDGREVFLEVNPGGEWGMLEHDLDLPISEHMAAWLARPLENP